MPTLCRMLYRKNIIIRKILGHMRFRLWVFSELSVNIIWCLCLWFLENLCQEKHLSVIGIGMFYWYTCVVRRTIFYILDSVVDVSQSELNLLYFGRHKIWPCVWIFKLIFWSGHKTWTWKYGFFQYWLLLRLFKFYNLDISTCMLAEFGIRRF